jgi:hypothetical protein
MLQNPSQSDTDVSASELADLLTELEPVVSGPGRAGAAAFEQSYNKIRRRSLSSEDKEVVADER